jgi:hypothetical protein
MHWLDRKEYKEKIREWMNMDTKSCITVNVSDTREMVDIEKCLKTCLQKHFLIGVAILSSDIPNNKFDLFNQLVTDLGGKEKFSEFHNFTNDLGKNDNLYVIYNSQQIGTDISADEVDISGAGQYAPTIPESKRKSDLKEENADEFLEKFINDLNNFSADDSLLFLIKFLEKGFTEIDSSFKMWFTQIFLKRVLTQENIKVVVLDQGESDMMLESENHIGIGEMVDYDNVLEIFKLYHNDMPPKYAEIASKHIIHADGRIDEPKRVTYTLLARTFHGYSNNEGHDQICLLK